MKKRIVITEEIDGTEVRLSFEPVDYIGPLTARIGDTLVIAYCAQDNDIWGIDDLIGEGMGRMHSFHRHATKDHEPGLRALGRDQYGGINLALIYDRHNDEAIERYIAKVLDTYPTQELIDEYLNPGCQYEHKREAYLTDVEYIKDALRTDAAYHRHDCVMFEDIMESVLTEMWRDPQYFPGDKDAQLLDVYDHSGQHWSLSGGGMQCQWDTARGAGVWVPDETLRHLLDTECGVNREAQARKYCQQFLVQYNYIIAGEVYGIVIEQYEADGSPIDCDACWGYVGSKYAVETMRAEFDAQCKSLEKKAEVAA